MLDHEKVRSKLGNYWFKTYGKYYQAFSIEPPHHRHIFWSWFGSFCAIAIVAFLTSKVVMMTRPDWHFLLEPTLESSVIFVLCAVVFNHLAEERAYLKHWL